MGLEFHVKIFLYIYYLWFIFLFLLFIVYLKYYLYDFTSISFEINFELVSYLVAPQDTLKKLNKR